MRHNLEAIIERTVRFDIDSLVGIVDRIEDFFGFFIVMTTAIYFEFNAKIALRLAEKYCGRSKMILANAVALAVVAIVPTILIKWVFC